MAEDHTPSDEFLKGMGLVVLQWARAEHAVEWSLAELAHGSPIRQANEAGFIRLLLNNMEARTTAGLLKVIFRARFFSDADEFDALVDKLMKEKSRRDVVAHGKWRLGKRPNTYSATMFKSVGQLGVDTHEFSADEMKALAARIRQKASAMVTFLNARGYWQPLEPPSPPDDLPSSESEPLG